MSKTSKTINGADVQHWIEEVKDRLHNRRVELEERMSDISNELDRMDKEVEVIMMIENQLNELPKGFDDLDM